MPLRKTAEVEAFAKLADSLENARPLTLSLFASMFFVVVAMLAAGFGNSFYSRAV